MKINLRNHEFVRKKQNGEWKVSDTDWFYFSFYDPSCFFYGPSWSESSFILVLCFYSIRVGPSRSELIRLGLAVRVDPVRLADFCTCLTKILDPNRHFPKIYVGCPWFRLSVLLRNVLIYNLEVSFNFHPNKIFTVLCCTVKTSFSLTFG